MTFSDVIRLIDVILSDGICNVLYKRAKMALYQSPDYQTSSESIGLSVQEKKFNIDFQDGGHLAFRIRIILAIFDL